jgi:hypothetical protein
MRESQQPCALGLWVPIPLKARACLFSVSYSNSREIRTKDCEKNPVQSGAVFRILNKRVLKIHVFWDMTPRWLVTLPKLRRSWLHPSSGSEESKTSSWATQILKMRQRTSYKSCQIFTHRYGVTFHKLWINIVMRTFESRKTGINSSCVLPLTVNKNEIKRIKKNGSKEI